MKITCSKCKQIYDVDAGRIPPQVSSTKCKKCGNSIPLKPSVKTPAPSAPSAPKQKPLMIACQYCSQKYSLDRAKIPANLTSIKCKSCGHSIALKPVPADRPVSQPAVSVPASQSDILKITCLYCNQKYNIDPKKIPSGVNATKCKACGRMLSLKPAAGLASSLKVEISKKKITLNPQNVNAKVQPVPQVPIIQNIEPSSPPVWRKPKALAAAAAVLVVLLGVYFAGSQLIEVTKGQFSINKISKKEPQAPIKGSEKRALTTVEPFLAAKINVPLLLQAVEQNIPEEKKNIQYKMTTAILNSLELNKVQIYLYPDEAHTFLPVIVADRNDRQSLEERLNSLGEYSQFLERTSDGSYRFKKEAIPEDKQNSLPMEIYRIRFIDNLAVFAPQHLSGVLERGESLLRRTQVAQMMASIANARDLVVLSVRFPENFNKNWQEKLLHNPAFQENPQAAMMAGIGGGVLTQLTEPLKQVESLAIGLRLNDKNRRVLSYAQRFRKGVDGKKIYQQLKSGNQNNLKVDGLILSLIEILNDPRYQHKVWYKENRLALEFSWVEKNDQEFLASLTQATIGQLFAQSLDLSPSEGSIGTQYTDAPNITTAVDADTLKQMIPVAVEKSLFPGNYWNSGEHPRMTLDLDTVEIPNSSLAELTYEVLAVVTPDGNDIMRVEQQQFQHKINPGSATPGFININVKKGTPAQALGTAKIRFKLKLPASLKQLEFSADDTPGSIKESDGVWVKLGRLEKDVAKVNFGGGASTRLFAFDKTGQALAARESMSSGSSVVTRFQGVIDTLLVVVVKEMLDYPFEVEIDLNGGKELALLHKPEIPIRLRYDHHPIRTYVNYTEGDLSDLEVTWQEAGGMSWTDSLHVRLPKGPFNGDINWEVHFFGKNQPVYLAGNTFYGPRDISYGLPNGELKHAHAAFGKVRMQLASKIDRFSFAKEQEGMSVVQKLPSGKLLKVKFNKNEITYDDSKVDVIQAMAYDDQGRRLRKDNHINFNDGQKKIYFWGLPAKFVIDVAKEKISKTIDFDIRQRPVNESAYAKFKKDIEIHREIVNTLRHIAQARRMDRSRYGDDIAGLFYLYDRKQKKPMRLIEQQVAHSDPAGQKRFQYKLRAYKGYHFTLLSGVESAGVKNEYLRQPRQETYTWQKGSFKTAPYLQPPDLAAIPTDKTQPTFFIQFNQVYMKQLNGNQLSYLPQDYYNNGWVEAKFLHS